MIKITARHYVGLSNAHECNACHEKHLDLIHAERTTRAARDTLPLRSALRRAADAEHGRRAPRDRPACAGREGTARRAAIALANAALSMLEGEWNADARDELIEPARRWRDASERFLQLAHKER